VVLNTMSRFRKSLSTEKISAVCNMLKLLTNRQKNSTRAKLGPQGHEQYSVNVSELCILTF